jgi:hypothetical protein
MCGPYDLGWRLINAGLPEIWHDTGVALWHFAHPSPWHAIDSRGRFSIKFLLESTQPHVDYHALTAVSQFSMGRLLPVTENIQIFDLRMSKRHIGSKLEEKYARLTGKDGFSKTELIFMKLSLYAEFIYKTLRYWSPFLYKICRRFLVFGIYILKFILPPSRYEPLISRYIIKSSKDQINGKQY